MFKSRTVFVVGAGASTEFGLPMGSQLTSKIAADLNIQFRDGFTQSHGSKEIFRAVSDKEQGNGPVIEKLIQAGHKIASNMGNAISIDNYLHNRSDDEDIIQMGKIGIAHAILNSEKSSKISINDNRNVELSRSSQTWINVFCKMLHENVPRSEVEDIFNNISIICFNYDRCIEHYLCHALGQYFDLHDTQAQQLVNKLRIIHPYGRIGKLPWMNGTSFTVPYGASTNPHTTNLINLASGIRTFTERFEDDHEVVKQIRQYISNSEVLVFLGFAYGSMNLDLMRVTNSRPPVVLGTAFGISAPNQKSIKREIARMLGHRPDAVSVELADSKCYEFLSEYWSPIMNP